MFRKILYGLAMAVLICLFASTHAQQAAAQGSPYDQMVSLLQPKGFSVLYTGNMVDASGTGDATHYYVVMPFAPDAPNVRFYANSTDPEAFDNQVYAHTIVGYRALRQVFPSARTITVVVLDAWLSFTFTTDPATFDGSELSGASQAVFKRNQLSSVFYLNLVNGRGGLNQSTTTNTQSGNSTTSHVSPTATPVVTDVIEPCDSYSNRPKAGQVLYYIRNQYTGRDLTFTIGGPPWGTHDYKIIGDSKWYYIEIPPGDYTWTASVAGLGSAGSGARASYLADSCYSEDFRG